MFRQLRGFWKDESGLEVIEYVLLALILVLAVATIVQGVGEVLQEMWQKVLDKLTEVNDSV